MFHNSCPSDSSTSCWSLIFGLFGIIPSLSGFNIYGSLPSVGRMFTQRPRWLIPEKSSLWSHSCVSAAETFRLWTRRVPLLLLLSPPTQEGAFVCSGMKKNVGHTNMGRRNISGRHLHAFFNPSRNCHLLLLVAETFCDTLGKFIVQLISHLLDLKSQVILWGSMTNDLKVNDTMGNKLMITN